MALTLMAVHAHPDDECITTGGVLARYSAEGVETVLVTCTGGEVGEISDPALATPENLGEVRAVELAEACRILGVRQRFGLGYRDSGMMGTADNERPDAFWNVDMDEAVGKLVRIVRRTRPDVIVTYNERGDYGHPDHINAHRVAVAAFRAAGDAEKFSEPGVEPWEPKKLYHSAFPKSRMQKMREMQAAAGVQEEMTEEQREIEETIAVPDELITTIVDTGAYSRTTRRALAAHRTQMGPDNFFMQMPEPVWREMWALEHFRRIESHVPAPDREDDLFAGLR